MTEPKENGLPAGFLTGPGPEVQIEHVNFAKTDLPEYKGLYAIVLDGVLSREECDALVRAAQQHGEGVWERAMVNVGNGAQILETEIRNCGRIIWDSTDVVARLWARVAPHVAADVAKIDGVAGVTGEGPVKRKEIWEATRLNERMRFLKYGSGEYFREHCDGTYVTPAGDERSMFTLHLYLNDAGSDPADPLKGGATTFHSRDMTREYNVAPKIGRVLLFQHRHLIHSGAEVFGGTKLTMRTDLMFRLSDERSTKTESKAAEKIKSLWSSKAKRQKAWV